jgi:hypothetical protein
LGQATREEHRDAVTSAEFLLRVTSVAAGGNEIRPLLGDDAPDPLRSTIDRTRSLEDRPWWAVPSLGGRDEIAGNYAIAETMLAGNSKTVQGWSVCGSASKGTVAVLLLLFVRAPILSAALIATAIACGFSTSLD